MTLRTKTYEIDFAPIPWKRAGVNLTAGKFFDRQKQEKLAFGLYILAQHGSEPFFEGPLLIEANFYMPLARAVSSRKASLWHYVTPDLDNLCKMLLDTINDTQTVWHDDRQVSKIIISKLYDKHPRTIFTISELE